MSEWRLYIDESGDHTYKHLDDVYKRYLGLTGVLCHKATYDSDAQPKLEALKKDIFRYDPDDPPILTRSQIKSRKRWFYVLMDDALNARWEKSLLGYMESIVPYTRIFTVVIDKKTHKEEYPLMTFDAYAYSLATLLNRVRGYCILHEIQADVVAESRGKVEDALIQLAYQELRRVGSHFGDGQYYRDAYPKDELTIRAKKQNVAGLQIADLCAYDQKLLTIHKNGRPFPKVAEGFAALLNQKVNKMVNQYGRYLLK